MICTGVGYFMYRYAALSSLLSLYEDKVSRKWVIETVVANSALQCDLQYLASTLVKTPSFDCQLVAMDLLWIHFRSLKKER